MSILFWGNNRKDSKEVTEKNPLPVKERGSVSAFGDSVVAPLTPLFQEIAVYGISSQMAVFSRGTGSGTVVDSNFTASSGIDSDGFGSITTGRPINYKVGQGLMVSFPALFSAGVANSRQLAGFLSGTNAACFGYDGEYFGVLHRHTGVSEIQILTVSSGAGGVESATITLDGTAYTVPLTAGTAAHNAAEIAESLGAQVFLFTFDQIGEDVVAVSLRPDSISGAFSFSSSTAAATWAQSIAGVSIVDDWTRLADFNGGLNLSWLDPAKGNSYKIQLQPDYGGIIFSIHNPKTGFYEVAHSVMWGNDNLVPAFTNPSFPAGFFAQNLGNTTDVTVKGSSIGGFVEGSHIVTREGHAEQGINIAVGTTNVPIMTIRAGESFNGVRSGVITQPKVISVASESGKSTFISIIKNCTLVDANFDYHEEGVTPILVDTSATACSGGDLMTSLLLPSSGSATIDLGDMNVRIGSGDTISVIARVSSGAASVVAAAIGWQDDY